MVRFTALFPEREGQEGPWAKHPDAWAALEHDYNIEAESGELPVARVAKLLALHGFTEEASTLIKTDTQAGMLQTAQRHILDAYANAHHAHAVMSDLCNAGDNEGKAMNGGHAGKAKEAHGAIGRAKEHAMAAAECLGQKFGQAEIEKALADSRPARNPDYMLTLLDDAPDPDRVVIKDEVMRDAMASLGPDLAALIAGHTRSTLNQLLGRID
jgi:hypothetical protein